ncbi:MAG TPA: hypothetical protein ENG83_07215 [Nitrospirae bacterium]|nr:hypothetical protein [Nitrospirota bacterium]HDZ02717.1 hypothetical protein [Nitrospirota bacterium]
MGYIDLIKEKEREKELLREKALKEAERLSILLRQEYEFDSLSLIGSVLKDRGFTRQSDIDFVIKGLRKELFFKALAFLISNSSFNIDLKPYEELDGDSKSRVERSGRKL